MPTSSGFCDAYKQYFKEQSELEPSKSLPGFIQHKMMQLGNCKLQERSNFHVLKLDPEFKSKINSALTAHEKETHLFLILKYSSEKFLVMISEVVGACHENLIYGLNRQQTRYGEFEVINFGEMTHLEGKNYFNQKSGSCYEMRELGIGEFDWSEHGATHQVLLQNGIEFIPDTKNNILKAAEAFGSKSYSRRMTLQREGILPAR
jgi:hypothetical protein